MWRKKYTGGDIGTANVDFDQDGKVDMKDFEIWRRRKLGLSITTVPSPTTNPNVGSCMCDLGAVVENSCAAGATAACTGKFSCACQTAPSPTSGGGYITLTPSPYPSGFDPYCPKSGRKVWYRVGYVCEHYECQFGTCVGVKTSPAEDQPDSCTSPGIACGGYGYNGGGTQPQPTATTAPAPTSTAQVPACSACGSLYAAKPGSLCSQVSCIGTESCVEVQATCTVNGVSNPNCYRAQCARTGDL